MQRAQKSRNTPFRGGILLHLRHQVKNEQDFILVTLADCVCWLSSSSADAPFIGQTLGSKGNRSFQGNAN
jgi:hypothetical protein